MFRFAFASFPYLLVLGFVGLMLWSAHPAFLAAWAVAVIIALVPGILDLSGRQRNS
jgi:hypothetical protein